MPASAKPAAACVCRSKPPTSPGCLPLASAQLDRIHPVSRICLISHSGSSVTEDSFYVALLVRHKKYPQYLYVCGCLSESHPCVLPIVLPTITETAKDTVVLGNQPFVFCLTCYSFGYCLHFPWSIVHRYDLMVQAVQYFYLRFFLKHASLRPLTHNFHFNLCTVSVDLLCYD